MHFGLFFVSRRRNMMTCLAEVKGEGRLKALCAGIKGVDPKLIEMILGEVVPQHHSTGVTFQDVAGQDKVRQTTNNILYNIIEFFTMLQIRICPDSLDPE